MSRRGWARWVAVFCLGFGSLSLAAEKPASAPHIPDEELIDQDGKPVRLYSDLIKGRTVVIDFIFTRCTTICLPLTATLARLQDELGPALGRDVQLISITLDPVNDTAERCRQYGEKFKRRQGWSFLTGDKERIDRVLKSLGGYVSEKSAHSALFVVGNDVTGRWGKLTGMAPPKRLVAEIARVSGSQAKSAVGSVP